MVEKNDKNSTFSPQDPINDFIECNKVADIAIPLAVFAVPRDGPEAVRVPFRVALPAAAGGEMGQRGTLGGTDGLQTRDELRRSANYRHYHTIINHFYGGDSRVVSNSGPPQYRG